MSYTLKPNTWYRCVSWNGEMFVPGKAYLSDAEGKIPYSRGKTGPVMYGGEWEPLRAQVGVRVLDPSGWGWAAIREVRSDGMFRVNWDGGSEGDTWWLESSWLFDQSPYSPGQTVRITHEGWLGAWSKGQTITLESLIADGDRWQGQWHATARNGSLGIIDPKDFEAFTITVEAGKTYRAANGETVGPMLEFDVRPLGRFIQKVGDGFVWSADGTCYSEPYSDRAPWNLVSEVPVVAPAAASGPVTRTIVPGVYGRAKVTHCVSYDEPSIGFGLVNRDGHPIGIEGGALTADELEALGNLCYDLAEALRP